MSYEPDFGGVSVSRIRKPFTQFLIKDASSSIYNRASSAYKSLGGRGIACATINGETRYVMTVANGTFYQTENLSTTKMTQTLFYSNNGKDWVACANNLLNYTANDVVWCGYLNKFFACGFGKTDDTRVLVVSSEDGITWEPAYSQNIPSSIGFVTIASSDNKIVIGNMFPMNAVNATKYSTDGMTWNDTSIGEGCTKVAWGNNLWTAVVDMSHLYWSNDGITWTTQGQEFDIVEINALKYDGTIWAAMGFGVGDAQSSVLVSNDGKTWNYQGDNKLLATFGFNDDEWISMGYAFNPTIFSFSISIFRSIDKGATWSVIAMPIYLGGEAVFWDDEKWIIVGSAYGSGYYGRSSPFTIYQDPITKLWTTRDLADQKKCNLFLQEKQVRAYENDGSFGTFN